ncbi:MAG: hypothetical protein FWC13_01955 [Oscillospiraceae bacterium]|nr:hypothetical protein [Oscillospiraceae bacterium]
MAGKKSESKLKSMLERRGLIRKVEDTTGDSLNDTITKYNPDIKPIFDTPDDSVIKTASRQPVPGINTQSFPDEPDAGETDKTESFSSGSLPTRYPTTTIDESLYAPSTPAPSPAPEPEPEPEPYIPPQVPPPQRSEMPPPQASFTPFRQESSDGVPAESPTPEPTFSSPRQQPDNYTERYLNINELYEALALRPRKTDSVYLIEEYLRTLPDSLPDSSRREIVNKIITASGFDYDMLMGDGVLRVKMLKEYAERFARHTDDYIAARHAEIESLEHQVVRAKKLLESRRDLHKRQFFTIEAEAQRLKEILTFISG